MSPSAKSVMVLADNKAGELGAKAVGTEHVLLACITIPSQAATIMQHLGFDPDAIENELAELDPETGLMPSEANPPTRRPGPPMYEQPLLIDRRLSESCEAAFHKARREATARKEVEVGVTHLLIGLMKVRGSNGHRLLTRRNATASGLRRNLYGPEE